MSPDYLFCISSCAPLACLIPQLGLIRLICAFKCAMPCSDNLFTSTARHANHLWSEILRSCPQPCCLTLPSDLHAPIYNTPITFTEHLLLVLH